MAGTAVSRRSYAEELVHEIMEAVEEKSAKMTPGEQEKAMANLRKIADGITICRVSGKTAT